MTTNEIADIIIKDLSNRGFPIFLTTFSGCGFSEADVFGITRNGIMYEYEIKRSRSDFMTEFKNKDYKHTKMKERKAVYVYDEWKNGHKTGNTIERIMIPNKFYFACEKELILPHEVPEYAGLVYVDSVRNEFVVVKKAKMLHNHKATMEIYERIATILSQRIIFGCSYYTYRLKNQEKICLAS